MFKKKIFMLTAILVVAAMLLGACGTQVTEAPVVEEVEKLKKLKRLKKSKRKW